MSITQQVTCDQCGKQKQDVNHWWIAQATANNFSAWPFEFVKQTDSKDKHLCGQECAHKALAAWMEAQAK